MWPRRSSRSAIARSSCRCTAASARAAGWCSSRASGPASSAAIPTGWTTSRSPGAARCSPSRTTTCTRAPTRRPRTRWSTWRAAGASISSSPTARPTAWPSTSRSSSRFAACTTAAASTTTSGRRGPPEGGSGQRGTPSMDFGFSEEQEMLRSSARDFLAKEAPMTYVRKMMEDEVGFTGDLWKKMADLGWMGLILPEEHGGSGLDFVDLIVVLEEMGRVVLPGPFFSTVVLGGVALLEGGSDALKQEIVPKLAAGDVRLTLAQLEPSGRWGADGLALEAKADGSGYVLNGTKLFVPDAHVADQIVVAGRAPGSSGTDGITLFLVDAKAPGIKITQLKTMDQTRRLSEVVLTNVRVGADRVLGTAGQGWARSEERRGGKECRSRRRAGR